MGHPAAVRWGQWEGLFQVCLALAVLHALLCPTHASIRSDLPHGQIARETPLHSKPPVPGDGSEPKSIRFESETSFYGQSKDGVYAINDIKNDANVVAVGAGSDAGNDVADNSARATTAHVRSFAVGDDRNDDPVDEGGGVDDDDDDDVRADERSAENVFLHDSLPGSECINRLSFRGHDRDMVIPFPCGVCMCYTHSRESMKRTYANCSATNMTHFPKNLSRNLDILDLSFNILETFNTSDALIYPYLLNIDISFNRIKSIIGNYIPHNLTSGLVMLKLSHNSIQEIANDSFRSMDCLYHLALDSNRLVRINATTFQGLSALSTLDLSSNLIRHINDSSFQWLGNLQYLYLNNNSNMGYFKNLMPQSLQNLHNLRKLDIQSSSKGNGYPSEALSRLPNLRTLAMDSMKDGMDFGPQMMNLTRLVSLSFGPVAFCRFRNIRSTFFQYLPHLTSLYITNCKIQTIDPHVFHHMPKLQHFGVINSPTFLLDKAFEILEGFGRNSSLKSVSFIKLLHSNSACITLSDEQGKYLSNLTSLRELDLSRNNLVLLSSTFIACMPTSLRRLKLSMNRFNMAGNLWNRLNRLTNLVELDIQDQNGDLRFQTQKEIASSYKSLETGHNYCRNPSRKDLFGTETGAQSYWEKDHHFLNPSANVALGDEKSNFSPMPVTDKISNSFGLDEFPDNDNYGDRIIMDAMSYGDDVSDEDDSYNGIKTMKNSYEAIDDIEDRYDSRHDNDMEESNDTRHNDTNSPHLMSDEAKIASKFHLPRNLRVVRASRYNYFGGILLSNSHMKSKNRFNLSYVDFSCSYLIDWSGWHMPRSVTFANLSHNQCNAIGNSFFYSDNHLRLLDVQKNYLGPVLAKDLNGDIFASLGRLQYLDISLNLIYELPQPMFHGLTALRVLHLGDNKLKVLNTSLSHMTHLTKLDLSKNSITWISDEVRHQLDALACRNKLRLDLSDNPLPCTCDGLRLIRWMASTNVIFLKPDLLKCVDDRGHIMTIGNLETMALTLERRCVNIKAFILALVALATILIISVIVTLVYRHRWKLIYFKNKFLMGKFGFTPRRRVVDTPFKYSAHVVYSEETSDFVFDTLMPEMEENRKHRLCVEDRDFIPGSFIYNSITSAVQNSAHVILVISPDVDLHGDFMYATQMALMEDYHNQEKDRVCYILFLDDSIGRPLPSEFLLLMNDRRFLEMPPPGTNPTPEMMMEFWDRLSLLISR